MTEENATSEQQATSEEVAVSEESTVNEKPAYKRSKVYINPKFQKTAILLFVTMALISILQMVYFGWSNFTIILEESSKLQLEANHPYLELLSGLKSSYMKLIIMSSVGTLIFFFLGALYFTHKVAGPIYKIRKQLAEAKASGFTESTKIHLREGDFFTELADDVNELMDELKK